MSLRPWRAGTFTSREPDRGEVDNGREGVVVSSTGVDSLDRSIGKTTAWLTDIDAGFGRSDRRLAYRVLPASRSAA
jgi:hypothetical protein